MENENYNPLVSIIIPVYKGAPYLKDAIDSALNQTYKNIEVIVINDGSPDNGKTEEIAKSYGNRIRYFYKENGGVSTALNYGIKKMRGEWFSWLSHDDVYEPDKIMAQINAVSKRENKVCVVRCTTSLIDANGNPIYRPQKEIDGNYNALQMMKMHSLKEVGLYGCSLLIHKKILDACGFFNENLRAVQDEEYWSRIMFSGYEFVSISGKYVKIRVHSGQATVRLNDIFDPERERVCSMLTNYYNQNQDMNFELLYIFTLKQAKEHRQHLMLKLKHTLIKDCRFTLNKRLVLLMYSCYGYFYTTVKKLYKKLFVRR